MKNKMKRFVSSIVALALSAGMFNALPMSAGAATGYKTMTEWTFDDSTTGGWVKGGYWTNTNNAGNVGGGEVANEQNTLKLTEDFTTLTSGNWNQTSVQYTFDAVQDFTDAARVTFDYYTTEAPEHLRVVFTGSVTGTYNKYNSGNSGETTEVTSVSNANAEDRLSFGACAVATGETLTVDGTAYSKYSVTIPMTDGTVYGYSDLTNSKVRPSVNRILLGEVRTDTTYKGSALYDNIQIQKIKAETVTLDKNLAVYNTAITATPSNFEGGSYTYQWYQAASVTGEGTAINGETSASFTPTLEQVGGWIYCRVELGADFAESDRVRVAAVSEPLKETEIKLNNTTITSNGYLAVSNTKHNSGGTGALDITKLARTGYFYIEYTGELTGVPQLGLATWSSATKTTQQITATENGTSGETKWAKYSYDDCVTAWGDEDFTDLKALRIYYGETDKDNLTVSKISWFGVPLSYGDLGETVAFKGTSATNQYLFTTHVGGTFDATRIKEDSKFYIEYQGDADAVQVVFRSHSANADGTDVKSTYAALSNPSETGKTGSGYYSVFTAEQIKNAFGSKLRYVDGISMSNKSGKTLSAVPSMYFFEGEGALVDDISQADALGKTYDKAINVPWTKYDDTGKDGIAVIGASISQNPLVNPKSLEGKPYYNASSGWNTILDRTDVVTYGIGSQTTDNIAARFHEVLDYDYKAIIIQCGNNDLGAFNGEGAAEAAALHEYDNYCTMMDMVQAKNTELAKDGKPAIPVYIIAINPVGESSTATNAKIPVVVQKLKTLENTYDFVTYIEKVYNDFLSPSATTENPYVNPELVMSDGLHPVAEGYTIHAKYLKPLLSSLSNEADATLASLSYRMSSDFNVEEPKKVVDGFQSAKTADSEGYNVTLPAETAEDATFRLYTTASNIAKDTEDTSNATVTVNGAATTGVDEYGNDYTEITLENGTATVEVVVTAADGATKETYTVNFTVGEKSPYIYENDTPQTVNVTDDIVSGWSEIVAYNVNYTGTIYPGATIEFDVTAEDKDFTSAVLNLRKDWGGLPSGTITLNKSDFESNTAHVTYTYNGDSFDKFGTFRITGAGTGDYRGNLTFSNVKIKNGEYVKPASTVTLDKNLVELDETITAEGAGFDGTDLTYQWYSSTNAAGTDAAAIDGKTTAAFTPEMAQVGGWIYCSVSDGTETVKSASVRVVASKSKTMTIELPVTDTKIGNYDLALLNNVTTEYGKIDVTKWAVDGYIRVEYTGINDGEPSALPQLELGTWSVDGKQSKDINAARHGAENGTVWAEYKYEDLVSAWYNDADFTDVKSIRVHYSGADKANLNIVSAKYVGPTLSYGDLGTPVSLRGNASGYQYLFTRHVGGSELDATALKEDGVFYVEYAAADSAETVNLVAQCHSAKADGTNVKSTYAVIAPTETGKTGSGNYAKYTVAAIKEKFGAKFRYIDGLRLATSSGNNLSANAALYLFEGEGELVDDISAGTPGYTDAVDVPWTLYDDDDNYKDKDGIAVIGASITQNPLVTALAMSGKPFYSPNGGWSPMLDRTDVVTYGIGSQTTNDITARFHEVLDYDYKQIIIQCGNNDLGAFNGEGAADAAAEQAYNNYVKMLDMVKAKNETLKADGKPIIPVHILALNPVNSDATNAKIPTVITKVKTLEQKYDFVHYVDSIYNEFRDESTGHSKTNLVMSDGLHPVAEGYAIYAKYLKPLIATNDDTDSTLASLSYRMSGDFTKNEAKKVVNGFTSAKPVNTDGYDVTLPSGTASDASFRLYTTASNTGHATVKVNGETPTADEYTNDYTTITLTNGAATANVVVTAVDGTTSTYTVRFQTDGSEPPEPSEYIYESTESKSQTVTGGGSNWPYVQFDVNYADKVYTGSTVEYDVTVDNTDFETLYLETDFDWGAIKTENVSAVNFENNKLHVIHTYEGSGVDKLDAIQIKTGETNTAYKGNWTISNVKIKNNIPETTVALSDDKAVYNTAITLPKDESDTKEYTYQWYKKTLPNGEGTVISGATAQSFTPTMAELGSFIYCARTSGDTTEKSDTVPVYAADEKKTYTISADAQEIAANTLGTTLNTSLKMGTFNPETIKPHGQFKVTYTGGADIELALSYWHSDSDSKWTQAKPSAKGDGYAIFDYNACVDAYGQDFSDLEYITVRNVSQDKGITVTRVEWEGYPVSYGDLGEGVGYIDSGATTGILGYLYTEHVGGEFRAQDMKTDSYFFLEYKGEEKDAVNLAFSSVSGAKNSPAYNAAYPTVYATVTPSSSGATGTGWYAMYTVADIRKQFGDNFGRIDQINIATADGKTVEKAVLYYFEGSGTDVETDKNDIAWINRDKTGIAIIGDSIVQNPLVTDAALTPDYPAKGDWNALLGRDNVSNYGIGGETSVHISNRFYQLLLDGYDYDKIVMWFGVNDTGLVSSAQAHADRVTGNYRKVLNQIKTLNEKEGAKKKLVYVLSILPTTTAYYEGSQDRIVTTNAALKAMCESEDYKDFVRFVNVYDALLSPTPLSDCTHDEPHAEPTLFFDGLHPNSKGYAKVAEILNPVLDGCYCDVTESGGTISYKTGYTSDAAYDAYVAAYDANGALVGIKKNEAAGSFADSNIKTVKAFFWKKGSMTPVYGAVENSIGE